MGDVRIAQGSGYGEYAGEAGGVVADAGGMDNRRIFLFDGVDGSVGGEDGVEVGGEQYDGDGPD